MVFLRMDHDGVGETVNFLHDLVHGLLLDQVVEASRDDHIDRALLVPVVPSPGELRHGDGRTWDGDVVSVKGIPLVVAVEPEFVEGGAGHDHLDPLEAAWIIPGTP